VEKSTAIPGLSRDDINARTIILPPIKEQQQIIEKIEELFSELEAGRRQLETVREQLKTYRQAVLKSAFEGKLTNENLIGSKLPEGWKLVKLKEIVSVLGDGLHGTPFYSQSGEYYFINGNNLGNGKIILKRDTKTVDNGEFHKYKKELTERTILVSINGTLGNIAFYNNEKIILGKSACYFNLLDCADKKFISYAFQTLRFINYANQNATGSTIKNVSLKAMREFEFPIPPTIEKQRFIVGEIESRFYECDKIEATIETCLQRTEALKQSIFKQAFEGKLVKQ
jgi:type I restriction enzyme S subunit